MTTIINGRNEMTTINWSKAATVPILITLILGASGVITIVFFPKGSAGVILSVGVSLAAGFIIFKLIEMVCGRETDV